MSKDGISKVFSSGLPFSGSINSTNFVQFEHRWDSFYGIDLDGNLWVAGMNDKNQLGISENAGKTMAVQHLVKVPNLSKVISVGCGKAHAIVVCEDGSVYAAGDNSKGQLGTGDLTSNATFRKINGISDAKIAGCGATTSFIIKKDNSLFACGENAKGQLGIGNTTSPIKTFTDTNMKNVKEVRGGLNHSILLRIEGTVWTSGDNSKGQLGLGDYSQRNSFNQLPIEYNNIRIDAGDDQILIVKTNGDVMACGEDLCGMLCTNTTKNNKITKLPTPLPCNDAALQKTAIMYVLGDGNIAMSGGNTLYSSRNKVTTLTKYNKVYDKIKCSNDSIYLYEKNGSIWYNGNFFDVFNPNGLNTYDDFINIYSTELLDVNIGKGSIENINILTNRYIYKGFTKFDIPVACGGNYTFILKNDGTVYSSGNNSNGQLGLGNGLDRDTFTINQHKCALDKNYIEFEESTNPVRVEAMKKILNSDDKFYYLTRSNVLKESINLYDNLNSSTVPNVKDFSMGKNHVCYIDASNNLYSKGDNTYGQLGISNFDSKQTFTKVSSVGDVKEVICDEFNTAILTNGGNVYVCGANGSGQLGLGDLVQKNTPTKISIENVKKVALSRRNTYVLTKDGVLYGAGDNSSGQLNTGNPQAPARSTNYIEIDTGVKDVFAGADTLITLKGTNQLFACGSNFKNKLGMDDPKDTYASFTKIHTFNNLIRKVEISASKVVVFEYGNLAPVIEYVDKSMPSFKLRVLDDDPVELVFSVNGNPVRTVNSGFDQILTINLEDTMFNIGNNVVSVKVTDATKNVVEDLFNVRKQNVIIQQNNTIFLDNKKYKVLSKTDNSSNVTVTLDKEITRDIVPNESAKLFRDNIKVELISGEDGSVSEPTLVSVQPSGHNGLIETYEITKQYRTIRPKLTVLGNKDTTIKRPSILANFLEE